jgi:uncharacterized protein (TIGR02217 family)
MGILSGRFPDDISVGAEGGWPGWMVTIIGHAGGQETANLDDPESRGRWNVARVVEEQSLHDIARRFFIRARGPYHYFRFKDHADFEAPRTGDDKGLLLGSGTSWTVNKVYADSDEFEYIRRLYRIVDGSERIWRNGALQTRTTHYTIDNDSGIVTSLSSWTGDTLEIECEFDVLCRFDMDRLSARLEFRQQDSVLHLQWPDIDIVEVRETDPASS